jgi:hypothetical protein
MKKRVLILFALIAAAALFIVIDTSFAQEEAPPAEEPVVETPPPVRPPVPLRERVRVRFIDEDGDGFNDNAPGRNPGFVRPENGQGQKNGHEKNKHIWGPRDAETIKKQRANPPLERGLQNAINRIDRNILRLEQIRERLRIEREQMIKERIQNRQQEPAGPAGQGQ